jgi:hypothetical protein
LRGVDGCRKDALWDGFDQLLRPRDARAAAEWDNVLMWRPPAVQEGAFEARSHAGNFTVWFLFDPERDLGVDRVLE